MKPKYWIIPIGLLVAVAAMLLMLRPLKVEISRTVMGTSCSLKAVSTWHNRQATMDALEQSFGMLQEVDRIMSDYKPDSDLSRLNAARAGEPVSINPKLSDVLRASMKYTSMSGGAFDPSGRPLFQLWKSAGKKGQLPTEQEIADARSHVGWDKLTLQDGLATKSDPGLQIDLGAIAKGYGVDLAVERLRQAGMAGGLVEAGGDLRVFGQSPDGKAWRIGVQHPFRRGALCGTLVLKDLAVATSGNYERFTEIGGKRYSHILDPRTGRPVDFAPSVTVVARDCMTADAWATTLSVLGPSAMQAAEQAEGVEVMMVIGTPEQHTIQYTQGFRPLLLDGQSIKLD